MLPSAAPGSHGGSVPVPRAVATVCPRRFGQFSVGGGVFCLFLCCREVGGGFCAGLGRPSGSCASWLPPLRGCGGPRGGSRANSPAHRSRSQPPAAPATSLPQPPQKGKYPGNPLRTRCRCLPGRAGGRGWFPWRSLPNGGGSRDGRQHRTAAPLPLPLAPVCRGQARGRAGSAVSLDFCDDCKEPCLNFITVCGWVRC